METIREYIEEIFEHEMYEKIEVLDDGCSIWKNKEDNDFWIVAEKFCLDEEDKLFENYKKIMINYVSLPYDKNTSLLYIKEIGDMPNEIENAINIENDPFYYKKYVLLYTKNDWEKIKNIDVSRIGSALISAENFKELKEKGAYDLLYKIAHKLPFLKLAFREIHNLEDINSLLSSNENDKILEKWIISLPNERSEIENIIEKKIKEIVCD